MEVIEHPISIACEIIRDDPETAWAWHCNIAMPIKDELGITHEQANRMAATLMLHLFDVDTSKHARFVAFEPLWKNAR